MKKFKVSWKPRAEGRTTFGIEVLAESETEAREKVCIAHHVAVILSVSEVNCFTPTPSNNPIESCPAWGTYGT